MEKLVVYLLSIYFRSSMLSNKDSVICKANNFKTENMHIDAYITWAKGQEKQGQPIVTWPEHHCRQVHNQLMSYPAVYQHNNNDVRTILQTKQ